LIFYPWKSLNQIRPRPLRTSDLIILDGQRFIPLKELLGHAAIEMTQLYGHLVNRALSKAVNVADEVLG
jgi:site-specific recombinase XerD